MLTDPDLKNFYRNFLLGGVVPFWLEHGIDRKHGGLLTCLDEDGRLLSTDKFLWSQGRAIWTFAALYNRIEANPAFLEIAHHTADFCIKHGIQADGNVLFRTSRDGTAQEGHTSVYANLFLAYGLNELFKACGNPNYLKIAVRLFKQSAEDIQLPYFNRLAPYSLPEQVCWVHGPAMIGLETANELAATTGDLKVKAFVNWALQRIMTKHLQPEHRTLLEHLGTGDSILDTPPGRTVVPGHTIESMWFVIHAALRLGRQDLVLQATAAIRWMHEAGWDSEFGGLFLGLDSKGGIPWFANAEKKLWWVHCESLYALLLSKKLTGETWCDEWFQRVQTWSLAHHGQGDGEWIQRLDRSGQPVRDLIALPVKDPFHLPRALILMLQLLSETHPHLNGDRAFKAMDSCTPL